MLSNKAVDFEAGEPSASPAGPAETSFSVHDAFFSLRISSAVAPMLSMWAMTRLWAPLQPAVKKFLDEARNLIRRIYAFFINFIFLIDEGYH